MEAVFKNQAGVVSVVSGYAGGRTKDPTYEEVCSDTTGHAEVVRISYDPQATSLEKILELFWKAHDPTTLDRQGPDLGSQYRSVVFYTSDAEREQIEDSKRRAQALFSAAIVTEIAPLEDFYAAEGYHQDYYERNPNAGYCALVIRPKIKKLGMGPK
jgi:peptide-methionine (S)-S-oxide reductase